MPDTEWLTTTEVAAALGAHPQTVHAMRRAGTLPARPHGQRGWRYARAEVERLGAAPRDGAIDERWDARDDRLALRDFAIAVRDAADALLEVVGR